MFLSKFCCVFFWSRLFDLRMSWRGILLLSWVMLMLKFISVKMSVVFDLWVISMICICFLCLWFLIFYLYFFFMCWFCCLFLVMEIVDVCCVLCCRVYGSVKEDNFFCDVFGYEFVCMKLLRYVLFVDCFVSFFFLLDFVVLIIILILFFYVCKY